MATDWQMPRRGEACFACQTAFDFGTIFHAFLYETQQGYERRDYCLTCDPPTEPATLGSWRTRRPQPTVRKAAVFDREAVLGFFQRLSKAERPEQIQFRFVLALLLWRKKVLKFDSTQTLEGQEHWRFLLPVTQESYDVLKPELDEEEIEKLSGQLEDLLAGAGGDPELNLVSTTEEANG